MTIYVYINDLLNINCLTTHYINKSRTDFLVGLEPNLEAYHKSNELDIADFVSNRTLKDYSKIGMIGYDLIVAWRVLHLGNYEECKENIERTIDLLGDDGYLAISVSDRFCDYFNKTKNEVGGSEIEEGTIFRKNSGI